MIWRVLFYFILISLLKIESNKMGNFLLISLEDLYTLEGQAGKPMPSTKCQPNDRGEPAVSYR